MSNQFLSTPLTEMSYPITPVGKAMKRPLMLQVVVDTEEEFDWFAPPDHAARAVTHFKKLHRFQELCQRYSVKPCYVVDHPVATDPLAYDVIKPWLEDNACVVGAHLHPWVNPPYVEELNFANMYPGNLPETLELEKMRFLKEAIVQNLGISPTIYKSGRYGFGPHTAKNLLSLGFKVDLSFSPAFDMRDEGGPNHKKIPVSPFLIGEPSAQILSLPGTGAIIGAMPWVHDFGRRHERFKLPGVFSRLGLADRIKLSPEGFTSDEHKKLTQSLVKQGVSLFSLTLHSSSLSPGCSPYVSTERDVDEILARCERYFNFFFSELGGIATTPDAMYAQLT